MRWIAGALAGMCVALCAGEFAPPAEGPVPFRRDQIPLNEEAMVGLSKQLTALAQSLHPSTARERRGTAQMLALATALDPANSQARELIAQYQKERKKRQKDQHASAADAAQQAKQRSQLVPVVAWLESPEAGSHGQALATCLKDILAITDPQHPEAEEKGAWAGWIPDIAAYESTAVAKNEESKESAPPIPTADAQPKNELPLTSAEVSTLLWQKTENESSVLWSLAVAPLQMSAIRMGENDKGKPRPFAIVIGAGRNESVFIQLDRMLLQLLTNQHGNLPPGYRISINSAELEQSLLSHKRQTLSAAAAVLASSAVTGHHPEAIILGQIDETGAYKLPSGFWDQLQSLGKGHGQRLVLPAEAAPYLSALLALEKPGFFLEYEVLLAADFKQLLNLTSREPDETVTKTSAKFREVRERLGTQDIRQYIANRFVRQRLANILEETPSHASAKMLLIQAAGKRPTMVTRPVLAAELRRALEPMSWLIRPTGNSAQNGMPPRFTYSYEFTSAQISKIASTFELCRTQLDELERHTDKGERELLEQTRKTVNGLRTLERATRMRGESYVIQQAVRSAYDDLTLMHRELSEKLGHEVGE